MVDLGDLRLSPGAVGVAGVSKKAPELQHSRLVDEVEQAVDHGKLPGCQAGAMITGVGLDENACGLFESLVEGLDAEDPPYSGRISQIDVSSATNAKVTVVEDGEVVELLMGDKLFRHRFEVYLQYIDSWKRQFGKVASVDLRIKDQVVVTPYARTSAEAAGKGR